MSNLHFAEPQWFHLFWGVACLLVVVIWLEHRLGGDLSLFMHPVLQSRLVKNPSPARRYLRIILLVLCGCFLILSLMRPQWGFQFVATPRVGAEIMVCLDVSKSMLAEDVAPSRLERAKAELTDLLTYLDGDQVGLIAFAGRASVLSPLTPDFGFLRLVLDQAGPHTVVRGGTRLEEPIRKAVAGFGDTADISRSILLITDGEDHDSFPIEAAKDAAERGVRILSIGFGDENGSEIMMTDPKTGARSMLRDGDGEIVKSRLDGDLLREIAFLTEGAYIPAGTGVLDLKSIFDTHIAGLTRGEMDGRGRTVRNDSFQITLLLGLLSLLGAVVSTIGSGQMSSGSTITSQKHGIVSLTILSVMFLSNTTIIIVIMLLSLFSVDALAQQNDKQPVVIFDETAPPSDESASLNIETEEGEQAANSREKEKDPRTIYNEALQKFDADLWDQAGRLFREARRNAGTDSVVRYNATYNLGWVEVERADSLLGTEPKSALESLYRAADWFREAVTLRDDIDARHNLEVVLKRAMVLSDSLGEIEKGDLLKKVNETIVIQREFLDVVRKEVDLGEVETYTSKQSRRKLRSLAVQQLDVLSESQQLTKDAGREVDSLRGKNESDQTPEDKMRVAQLERLLHYLHRSQERMGQARRRLRTSQIERAYRRAATALTELKRGRDQLLDPVTRIDVLLNDSVELIQQTGVKANQGEKLSLQPGRGLPVWLTGEYLTDTQTSLSERVQELYQGLSAGLANQTEQEMPEDPEQQQLIGNLQKAVPWIGKSQQRFSDAIAQLESFYYENAIGLQNEGITSLATAREFFLDLRQLIESVYQDQIRIQQYLDPSAVNEVPFPTVNNSSTDDLISRGASKIEFLQQVSEYFPLISEFQDKNIERTVRLANLIELDLNQLNIVQEQMASQAQIGGKSSTSKKQIGNMLPSQSSANQSTELEVEKTRLEEAKRLQKKALEQFTSNRKILTNLISKKGVNAVSISSLRPVKSSVDRSVQTIEQLRRLFFSLIEHLRDTAQKQVELGDETQDAITLAETASKAETLSRLGPLSAKQHSLSAVTDTIADALAKQSEHIVQQSAQNTGQNVDAGQILEKIQRAGQLVSDAKLKMDNVVYMMTRDEIPLDDIGPQQKAASKNLIQALALLEPPQQQQEQDQQQQEQDQQQQEQDQQQQEQNQQQQQEQGNLNQMLQGVRDREAQRRQDQKEKQKRSSGYEPVEKDW